jgi:hypothetical protein
MFRWRLWSDSDNYDLVVTEGTLESTVLMNTSDDKVYRWRMQQSLAFRLELVGLVYTKTEYQLMRGGDYV